jgi:hypothetical protein
MTMSPIMMYDSSWLYVAMWMKLVLNPRRHISNLVELENKIKFPNWMWWPSQKNVTDLYVDGQMGHTCLDSCLTPKERTTRNLHTKLVPLMAEWHCAAFLSWVVNNKSAVIMLLSLIHSEHLTLLLEAHRPPLWWGWRGGPSMGELRG